MKVSVAGIYDRGNLDKERVHFRADIDLNLSFFVLLDTRLITPTEVTAGNLSAFWFPPRPILRGQHVVVYTRAGSVNSETRNDGSIFHFLFRGLPNPLYAAPQATAVLVEVQTWASATMSVASLPPLPLIPSTLLPGQYDPTLADLLSGGLPKG
jgi:hypothetical protein